ncbi:MAG TPA: ATP-binding protein [Acidimicrobiales bacterium]
MDTGLLLQRLVTAFEPWSCNPTDRDEDRARKAQFTLAMTLIVPAGVVWGAVYAVAGVYVAALIPLAYAVLSAVNLVVMRRTRNFSWFQRSELALIILLPFALQLALGGFVGGSAVVVWALLGPLFAVLFTTPREAVVWFGAFLTAVIVAGIVEPSIVADNELPDWLVTVLFVMNVGTVFALAFAMLVSFMRVREQLRSLEVAYLEQTVILRQREKLATLGTLAAGVAHEINNPAAAVRRASEQLEPIVTTLQRTALLAAAPRETGDALATALLERRDASQTPSSPLLRAEREAELEDWLDAHGVAEPWEVASSLAAMGVSSDELDVLADATAVAPDELAAVIAAVAQGNTATELVDVIADGARRISEIVAALRSYTYLDRGTIQQIDVTEGLESTLVLLQSRLKNATVVRDYAESLPRIAARGNELNQVWTNLIANAVDATDGAGTIVVRTRTTGDAVIVEVEDDGTGISPELVERVFDPFFTTKPPGKGTGLGLSISHNIVVRQHSGEMSVRSEPGRTVFTVTLPLSGACDSDAEPPPPAPLGASHDDA